jgi:hypothetical protein
MGRQLRGRQTEDQPTVTGIDGRELEYVTEERAIALRIRGEDQCMHSGDHVRASVL